MLFTLTICVLCLAVVRAVTWWHDKGNTTIINPIFRPYKAEQFVDDLLAHIKQDAPDYASARTLCWRNPTDPFTANCSNIISAAEHNPIGIFAQYKLSRKHLSESLEATIWRRFDILGKIVVLTGVCTFGSLCVPEAWRELVGLPVLALWALTILTKVEFHWLRTRKPADLAALHRLHVQLRLFTGDISSPDQAPTIEDIEKEEQQKLLRQMAEAT